MSKQGGAVTIRWLEQLVDEMKRTGVASINYSLKCETIEIAPDDEGWRRHRIGPRRKLVLQWARADIEQANSDNGEKSDWERY